MLWALLVVTRSRAGLREGSEHRSLVEQGDSGYASEPGPEVSARLTSSPLMLPMSLRGYYHCAHFTEEEAGASGNYVVPMWCFEASQLARGSHSSFNGTYRALHPMAPPARGVFLQLSPEINAQLSTATLPPSPLPPPPAGAHGPPDEAGLHHPCHGLDSTGIL